MYKTFTLLIVLFFINTTINAQDKEEYDKAVDYCACKIAYAYTNQYISNGKPEKYDKKDFNREKKSFEKVIKAEIEICAIENPITFENLSNLLKDNNFKVFEKGLSNVIIKTKENYSEGLNKKQAINSILAGLYKNEDFKGIIAKYSDVKDLKIEFKEELSSYLVSFKDKPVQNTSKIEENTSSQSIEEIPNNAKKEKGSFMLNWLSLLLILFSSVGLFLYNYFNNKKLKDSIKRHRNEIEYLKSSLNQSNNHSQSNSQFERNINQKITDLNFAIEKLQKDNSNSQIHKQTQIEQTKHTHQSNQKETEKFVYAKTPIAEKIFNAFDISEEKDGKFYKFTITNNKNQAEFEFFNTENSAKRAVNSPDNFLYFVCEEIEPLNQNAKKIITNKKGIAIKQDDKWIVTEKAQITYE